MSSLSWNVVGHSSFPSGFQGFDEKREAVRKHVARSERLIDVRPASHLEVRPRPEMLSSGIPALDELTGGIPVGCLTEIWGAASSGKTSVLVAAISAATHQNESCVLVDASDSFDPYSAAKAGMDFSKLLWVRCGEHRKIVSVAGPFAPLRGGYKESPAKHSPISDPTSSQQSAWLQTNSLELLQQADGRRPRREDDLSKLPTMQKLHSEHRLEQVLKTTDLVLQSGDFGLVVLDLAGIPEKFVRRIPLASWFRFQRAVEYTKTALLVISEFACAQTCATLVIKVTNELSVFNNQSAAETAHARVLQCMRSEAEITRSRLERKPMQSVRAIFESKTVRAG